MGSSSRELARVCDTPRETAGDGVAERERGRAGRREIGHRAEGQTGGGGEEEGGWRAAFDPPPATSESHVSAKTVPAAFQHRFRSELCSRGDRTSLKLIRRIFRFELAKIPSARRCSSPLFRLRLSVERQLPFARANSYVREILRSPYIVFYTIRRHGGELRGIGEEWGRRQGNVG